MTLKPVLWVGPSKADLKAFPDAVRDAMGFVLYQAQRGGRHTSAKPLKGFGSAGVLEIVDDFDGDTYRTVYPVRLQAAIYVLHAFQKKSKHGIAAPQHGITLIGARLTRAEEMEAERVAALREEEKGT